MKQNILSNVSKPSINHYLDLLWVMTEKEIKVRYKKNILGFLWIILNPLLQMVIIGVVFSLFIKIPNYFLFLLSGLIPWTFFSQASSRATVSIVNERSLLKKAKFPIEVIPFSIVLSSFFNLIISLILLTTIILLTKTAVLTNILFLIPASIWLLVITSGVSLLTSALYVQYRDVGFMVRTLITLGFYATPVVYSLSLIPARLRFIFALNPLASIVELFHLSLLKQGAIDRTILSVNILITIAFLLLGLLLYIRKRKYFVDWI